MDENKRPDYVMFNGKAYLLNKNIGDDENTDAEIRYDEMEIGIRKNIHPIKEGIAICHEMIHDTMQEMRNVSPTLPVSEEMEESIAEALGLGTYAFITNNKEIISWIIKNSNKDKDKE